MLVMTVMNEKTSPRPPKGSRAPSPERLPEGFTDEMLREMTVKALNVILKKRKDLSEAQIALLKKRKRTLKNRGYAKTNRDKKSSEEIEAQRELEASEKVLNKWKSKNLEINKEIDALKKQVLDLISRYFENGIPLKIMDPDLINQINGSG